MSFNAIVWFIAIAFLWYNVFLLAGNRNENNISKKLYFNFQIHNLFFRRDEPICIYIK